MKVLEKINKRYITYYFLGALFLFAFFLRFYHMPQNLFFGPEQGIDFFGMKKIAVDHKPVLIGAKTDIDGIFHGPVYYYLGAIPFILSQGSPVAVSGFFIFLNCLTVFFIFLLGERVFNRRVGLYAAVLFTVSFDAIVYSRWITQTPLAIPISTLFFLFLVLFLQGKKYALFGVAIFYGLIGQVEFLNFLYFAIILGIIMILFREKFLNQKKSFLFLNFVILMLSSAGNYLFFDLKNHFLISSSLLKLISGGKGYHISFFEGVNLTLTMFVDSVKTLLVPFSPMLASVIILLGLAVLILSYRSGEKYALLILLWICVPILILLGLRHDVLHQYFVGLVPVMILLLAVTIDYCTKHVKPLGVLILLLFISINFFAWKTNLPDNKNVFFQSTQPSLRFSDEKAVIDQVYKNANGAPFSFQSYTIPYWTQQGWQYLFWQYGQNKYGYVPTEQAKKLYVIIQDDPSGKMYQENWLHNTVTRWGEEQGTFRSGILSVRIIKVK